MISAANLVTAVGTRKRMLRIADAVGLTVNRFAPSAELAAELVTVVGLVEQLTGRERERLALDPDPDRIEQFAEVFRARAAAPFADVGAARARRRRHAAREQPEIRAVDRRRARRVVDLVQFPPATRGDCLDGPRPCPWTQCRYHLGRPFAPLSEVKPRTSGDRQSRDKGARRSAETCTLDLAAHGGITLVEVADQFGITRERVRQIEQKALQRIPPEDRELLAELLTDIADAPAGWVWE